MHHVSVARKIHPSLQPTVSRAAVNGFKEGGGQNNALLTREFYLQPV